MCVLRVLALVRVQYMSVFRCSNCRRLRSHTIFYGVNFTSREFPAPCMPNPTLCKCLHRLHTRVVRYLGSALCKNNDAVKRKLQHTIWRLAPFCTRAHTFMLYQTRLKNKVVNKYAFFYLPWSLIHPDLTLGNARLSYLALHHP